MKPRHADLFATDLDKETLVKYIDRFFMFYIRTADRLQRTSVWMENLEGGLDYLKAVIIDDKLGICAELEKEMALVIDTYECEWKKTLDDPSQAIVSRVFRSLATTSAYAPSSRRAVRRVSSRCQRMRVESQLCLRRADRDCEW